MRVTRFRPVRLNSTIIRVPPIARREESQLAQAQDANHPFCRYCGEATYHEYDPLFHAWVCQTCFGGMIRANKNDPLSVIRAELNNLAWHVAKAGYTAEVKAKLRAASAQLQKLAEGT